MAAGQVAFGDDGNKRSIQMIHLNSSYHLDSTKNRRKHSKEQKKVVIRPEIKKIYLKEKFLT